MNQVGAEILRDAEQALGSGVSLAPGDFYCYTFATPKSAGTDTDYQDTGFAYIHNVWEGYDMMTTLPFKVLGFARYGRDYHYAAIGDKEWMLELLEDLNPDVYEKYMDGGDPDGFKPMMIDVEALLGEESKLQFVDDEASYLPTNQMDFLELIADTADDAFGSRTNYVANLQDMVEKLAGYVFGHSGQSGR